MRRRDHARGRFTAGSISVEAAIAIPGLFIFCLFFVSLFQMLSIHKAMQEALTETGLTLSSYAYIGYKSGVLDLENALSTAVADKAAVAGDPINNLVTIYGLLKGDDFDADSMLSELEALGVGATVAFEDPKAFGVGLAYLAGQWFYEKGKTAALSLVVDGMLKNYLMSHHGWSEATVERLWTDGDLNYKDSRFLGVEPEMLIAVNYRVKPMFFTAVIPEFTFSNTVLVRCWGPGDTAGEIEKSTIQGWITATGVKKGGVFHTMKCMSQNHTQMSKNTLVEVEVFRNAAGEVIFTNTVSYGGKVYALCGNCAAGGVIP